MKGTIGEILSGTAILIGVYLFLSKGSQTVNIIKALSGAYTSGVKTLQGR